MLSGMVRWRRRVGAFIGGFEAGLGNRRLKGFQPSRAHLNTLIVIAAAGADITARARYLVRNNGYAANAIESWAGNVAGSGIKPSSLIAVPALKAKVPHDRTVSIRAPGGERPPRGGGGAVIPGVSIRAPAGGATRFEAQLGEPEVVSIRAPA